ncbi:MAG: hypothetical protein WCK76_12715, partial [Elusimicrobiota bacterium]
MKRITWAILTGCLAAFAVHSTAWAQTFRIVNKFESNGYALLKSSATVRGGLDVSTTSVSGYVLKVSSDTGAAGQELFYVSNAGLVGIGLADPRYRLHISGAAGSSEDIVVISTGGSDLIRMNGAGDIYAGSFTGQRSVTASSFTATGEGVGTPRLVMAGNVEVSSEAAGALGGGLRVSTNVYVVGFSSAVKYYGDGSSLTGIAGDNLGNHTAAKDLAMGPYNVIGAGSLSMSSITATGAGVNTARLDLADQVYISSETSTELGAGVYVSSNVYVIGYASATRFFGDGSGLTNMTAFADNMGNHTASRDLNMAGYHILNVSSLSVTGQDASGYSLWLSSGINMAGGRVDAGLYAGSGALLTDLNADNLTAGTVPLPRLSGITSAELAAEAGILDTQLSTISAPGKVADSALSANVSLLDSTETVTGAKTFASTVSVAGILEVPRVQLADNVAVSSEADSGYGAGVRISSNVYVVGFSSAAKYYGDGSSLTGLGGSGSALDADLLDELHAKDFVRRTGDVAEEVTGAKTFVSSVTMTGAAGLGVAQINLAEGISISSEPGGEFGGGARTSPHSYVIGISSAVKYYGDGSSLTGLGGSGSNLDAQFLDGLDSTDFVRRTGNVAETINGDKTFINKLIAARISLAAGVELSSTTAENHGGVYFSTHVYLPEGAQYYGDGSKLSGVLAEGAVTAVSLANGLPGEIPYQSAPDVTTMLPAGSQNSILQANGGAAPSWTSSPTVSGANITGIPAANIDAGKLGASVIASSIAAAAVYPAAVQAGTYPVDISGVADRANNITGGAAGGVPYQTANNATSILPAGTANYLLQSNGAAAPGWTNEPLISGVNITGVPAAAIAAGKLGPEVVASSLAVNAVYPGSVSSGTYGVSITGSAAYAPSASKIYSTDPAYAYGSATPYYGSLAYTGTRWRFNVSPNTPGAVEVAYADNADTTDGLHAAAGVNDQPNQLVRTDGSGYLKAGLIETASAANAAQAITRIYASDDSYIRYYTLPNFMAQARGAASGTWGIDITGTAVSANNLTGGAANRVPYQTGVGSTTFVAAPGANSVLFANSGAPAWTNAPTLSGANISGVPAANIAAGSLPSGVIASSIAVNAVYSGALAADAVTDVKVAAGADIAYSKLHLAGSIVSADITDYTIDTNDLKDASVRLGKLASDITALDVGTGRIKGLTGTYFNSLDGSSLIKISSVAINTVYPSAVRAGSYAISITGNAATATTATSLKGGLIGQVPYQSAANTTAMLAAGDAGDVLTAAGAAAPVWTEATAANTASSIVKRDATGSFTAGTITAVLAGTAANAGRAALADDLAGGAAGNIVYQSAPDTTSMVPAGTSNSLLQANGAGAPTWTSAPTITGTNITGIPAASILAGALGAEVLASSVAVNAVYPGAVAAGTYGVSITGNALTATTATMAATAIYLAGGDANYIPYQSAANTTSFVAAPGANMVLYGNNGAPAWSNTPA